VLAQYNNKVYIGLVRHKELVWANRPVCDIDGPCTKIPLEAFVLSKEVSTKPGWMYLVAILPTKDFHMEENKIIGCSQKVVAIVNSSLGS